MHSWYTDLPDLPLSQKLTCINTFIPIHCLNVAMDVRKNFFRSQELNHGTLFEMHIFTVFHFNGHRTDVMESCGFKVTYGGGETSHDCREPVLSSFHYSNKNLTQKANPFQPVLLQVCAAAPLVICGVLNFDRFVRTVTALNFTLNWRNMQWKHVKYWKQFWRARNRKNTSFWKVCHVQM